MEPINDQQVTIPMAMGATAAEKRPREEAGKARREAAFKLLKENGDTFDDPEAKIYMHDENTEMIQVCRTGRNPIMRTFGRVHGISTNAMYGV